MCQETIGVYQMERIELDNDSCVQGDNDSCVQGEHVHLRARLCGNVTMQTRGCRLACKHRHAGRRVESNELVFRFRLLLARGPEESEARKPLHELQYVVIVER
jgi:hypothetical protein